MDQINALITEYLGPLGPLLIAGFLGVLLVLIALPAVLLRKKDPLSKLRDQTRADGMSPEADHALRIGGKNEKLDKFAQFLEPQDQEEFSQIQLTLLRAGYRSKGAVQTFHFAQFALGMGFLALGVIYTLIAPDASTQKTILTVLIPGAVGYYLPKYWVTKRVQTREEEITQGFPDALDLMLVCVEAGQSLDQAIIRVAKEIRASFASLADELEIVAYEMKAGKDKTKVLKDFGERCGVQDVNSFVTVLIQSATFGTSIAEALRVYAEEMRDKRVMRAEEKANKLPTKLTLATMMFCVPPLLIILIGPSVYGIAQNLGGGMGGGGGF
ncbi:type II secretion system F family protein [Rhodobacteraceae bacterium W635]|uniref:type II secretion system F family protein n=1 Tax=Nioella halotolerans TaxID=2303578 RepID=UPI000E3C4054|nr:type II secretion system F family protein [Rhodobacteraceae bacterium W635]